MTDPLIGRQLANYRIERLIGRGGMASVYYAEDVLLNRAAAVKIIDTYSRRPEAYKERMLHEARAVAGWRHENIIQVYYAGDEDGMFFFAMEYIDGQNLADIIAAASQAGDLLPHDKVVRYGRAIANALDYAHTKNIIHRDVKPQNVLVAQDGRVVLTDFGLALNTQQGSLGEVFGTAHYTAPEQARRSNAAVAASDLYSLGVMLYEMLVGVLPFDDPSPTSVALQHITMPPPAPRQINPQLSQVVEKVLLKAIEKDPGSRYPSGKALMDALENALSAQPALQPALIPLPPPPPPEAPGMAALSVTPVADPGSLAEDTAAGKTPPAEPTKATRAPARAAPGTAAPGTAGKATISRPLSTPRPVAGKQHPHPSTARRTSRRWGALLSIGIGLGLFLALIGVGLMALLGQPGSWLGSTSTRSPLAGMAGTGMPAAGLGSPPPFVTTATPATPTHAASATPTVTASLIPATSTPTLTPSPLPPSATPRYLNGRYFILYYNESSFYMRQVSGLNGRVAPLVFERLDANGRGTNRFIGELWAQYNEITVRGWCMNIEILQASDYLRPAACEKHYLATRWPGAEADFIFWTAQPGSTTFRVLWHMEEVARCQIADGTCEVYLP